MYLHLLVLHHLSQEEPTSHYCQVLGVLGDSGQSAAALVVFALLSANNRTQQRDSSLPPGLGIIAQRWPTLERDSHWDSRMGGHGVQI